MAVDRVEEWKQFSAYMEEYVRERTMDMALVCLVSIW